MDYCHYKLSQCAKKECIKYRNQIITIEEFQNKLDVFIENCIKHHKNETDIQRILLKYLRYFCNKKFIFLSRKIDDDLEILFKKTSSAIKNELEKVSISNDVICSIITNMSIMISASLNNFDTEGQIIRIGNLDINMYQVADTISDNLKCMDYEYKKAVRKDASAKKASKHVILSKLFKDNIKKTISTVMADDGKRIDLNKKRYMLEFLTFAFYITALRNQELKEDEGIGW